MPSSLPPSCTAKRRRTSSIGSSVKRKVQKRVRQFLPINEEREDASTSYCGITRLSRDVIPLTYVPIIPLDTDRTTLDKLEWSWLMQHGHLKLSMLENIEILASPLATRFHSSTDDWFFLPTDLHPMSQLYVFYLNSGTNPRRDPYEAYADSDRGYLASKIIMSKRLHESVTLCRRGEYPDPQDVLRANPNEEFPFKVPTLPQLHIPSHILIYNVGRRLTARYSSTSWADVLPRVLEDYSLKGEIYTHFMEYCFEIYHVWMKAEPSEEWLSIPLPPQPGDALGLTETVCHFDDPVGVDPHDSSSHYKPPSDCSSYKSSDDKEVYITDQCYASKTAVEEWIQTLELVEPETTPPASPGGSDDSSDICVDSDNDGALTAFTTPDQSFADIKNMDVPTASSPVNNI